MEDILKNLHINIIRPKFSPIWFFFTYFIYKNYYLALDIIEWVIQLLYNLILFFMWSINQRITFDLP